MFYKPKQVYLLRMRRFAEVQSGEALQLPL